MDKEHLMEKPLFETSFSFMVDGAPHNKTIQIHGFVHGTVQFQSIWYGPVTMTCLMPDTKKISAE
jgi:hypothetical protein